jgi:hypothetical protein
MDGVTPGKGDELARREVVEVTCDICGAGTDRQAAKSARALVVDGKQYTIDLCAVHTVELDNAVAPFVAAARKAAGPGATSQGRRPRSRPTSRAGRHDMSEVRQWARANGFTNVAGRGRVPREVLAAWQAAHDGAAPSGATVTRPARAARKASGRTRKQSTAATAAG